MIVDMQSQFVFGRLLETTVGAAKVLYALVTHHVDLELLSAIESHRTFRQFACIWQYQLVTVCEPMLA